jgi:hypothetical protein
MLNIHLNGDIVSCPDAVTIKERLNERRHAEGKCKYGEIEKYCPAWQNYIKQQPDIKPFSEFGRCFMNCSPLCPHNQFRRDIGNMKKSFAITSQTYRKMSSASHYMVKEFKNKNLFLTLTFPPFKKHLSLNEANKLFSKFVNTLRFKKGMAAYVAVREHGTKNNRLHYHLLCNIPYIDFRWLNSYWCDIIADYCDPSPNAVQTDPKTKFIHNPIRAMKYVCKYFAKSIGTTSESRVFFISNNLLTKKYETGIIDRQTGEIEIKTMSAIQISLRRCPRYYDVADYIKRNRTIFTEKQTSDFTTRYRINNEKEFQKFCNIFLYPLFDLNGNSAGLETG